MNTSGLRLYARSLGMAVSVLLGTLMPIGRTIGAPTISIVHSFGDGTVLNDGLYGAQLTVGSDGNLYGTSYPGGSTVATVPGGGYGVAFMITPGNRMTILHSFGDRSVPNDGLKPVGGLVQGSDGNFYGMTNSGGVASGGTIYKMTPTGVVTILHSFDTWAYDLFGDAVGDGSRPLSGLIQGTDGNFYGATTAGGAYSSSLFTEAGTIFKVTPAGRVTVLHAFGDRTVVGGPIGPRSLLQATDGNFYGAADGGNFGGVGYGCIFKITPSGTVTILHSFQESIDGAAPDSLTQAADGNIYGITRNGVGNSFYPGAGTVFKMTLDGQVTTLGSFGSHNGDGISPIGLTLMSDGNFYGATQGGGSKNYGTVFQFAPSGGLSTLHSFGDGSISNDGIYPGSNLVAAPNGILYGTTQAGGFGGGGTIFTVSLQPQVPIPTITPHGGLFRSSQTVSITDSFSGATIYYTTDGSMPTTSSHVYTGPFTVSSNETVSANAVQSGFLTSETAVAPFTLNVNPAVAPSPVISPNGGPFTSPPSVTITDSLPGARIYYTTDGSTPSIGSTVYSGPFGVSVSETITAIAVAPNYVNSTPTSAVFTIAPPAPLISPSGGTFTTPQTVTITDSVPGAKIYYTDDGSTPTPTITSTYYTGPFVVLASQTITAIAIVQNFVNSTPASAVFTINQLPPTLTYPAGLQLFSVPYAYPGNALDTIFGYSNVKLAVWQPGQFSYAFTPENPANGIAIGQAYWVRFPTSVTITAGVPAAAGQNFGIPLVAGWNMIGDPFTISVPISSLLFNKGSETFAQASASGSSQLIGGTVWVYSQASNAYFPASTLKPLQGYWIYAHSNTDMQVPAP